MQYKLMHNNDDGIKRENLIKLGRELAFDIILWHNFANTGGYIIISVQRSDCAIATC